MKWEYLLFLLFCYANGYAQKMHTSKAGNPIIPDLIADPSIQKIDDTFYCYATTDGFGGGLATSGPPVVWKSNDFVSWSFAGNFFPSANGQKYWAPSKVVYSKGKYYLYPTLNNDIHVAVSNSPAGPFKLTNGDDTLIGLNAPKPLVPNKGPKGSKGIDAEIFVDDDAQAYIYWAQRGAAKLNADMKSLDTAVIIIATKRSGYSEGPIVFKRKGIYYYLYTLEGHENYKYAYGYSSVSPLGPFEFPENDIIASTDHEKKIYGPGHGCVFSDPATGDYYFGYLEFDNGGTNRQVWVDKVEFNKNGTIKPVVLTHQGVGQLVKKLKQTNLAFGKKATASSVLPDYKVKPIKDSSIDRTESYSPGNAIDESNGTRWKAGISDTAPWWMLDLGGVKKIKKTELYFSKPTAGHSYLLEYSSNGREWKKYGGSEEVKIVSPHVDKLAISARFLRVTILTGDAGLWEFKVY
ncbi:MAG TPA: family 43 glycosylhydrolase [Chitinophagaceae bacterium]|nr:family 43 glycosylhydrolase [Chitinophagaceae bacterium]